MINQLTNRFTLGRREEIILRERLYKELTCKTFYELHFIVAYSSLSL